jgi:hypothetical protein
MSAVAVRTLMRRINALHLLSLASIMANERKGVKGYVERPPTLQGVASVHRVTEKGCSRRSEFRQIMFSDIDL